DALADRLHGARALVAEHRGNRDGRLALLEVQVAAADAGGADLDEDLAALGRVELHRLERVRFVDGVEHGGGDAHGVLLWAGGTRGVTGRTPERRASLAKIAAAVKRRAGGPRSRPPGASLVRDGVRRGARQQDRIGREVDAVRPVRRIENELPLVGRAAGRDAGDLEPAELDERTVLGPQRGDVVGRVARGGQLEHQAERDRAPAQAAFQFLPQKVGRPLARLLRRDLRLARLRDEAVAAEAALAVLGREAEGVLGVIDRLRVA